MHIERKRWIVRRRHDGAIMCGTAKNYQFRIESEIGNAKICTYMSEAKAYASAYQSYHYDEAQVVAEPVAEIITTF
jgi:hypothetical protein